MQPAVPKKERRLAIYIGAFYSLLAAVNIVFFSIMIFENQTDLLQNAFKHHADSIVRAALDDLSALSFSRKKDESFERLKLTLAPYSLRDFVIFDETRSIWLAYAPPGERTPTEIEPAALRRLDELTGTELVFRARYIVELDESDYSLHLLAPLQGSGGERLFLSARIRVDAMFQRLRALYVQIGIAIFWGVLFHAAFAYYTYRLIFRRLFALRDAADRLAQGDLAARAHVAPHSDEIDAVGSSFNRMAANIEQNALEIQRQLTTIARLNEEIDSELQTGREVQRSFLPDLGNFAEFNPAVFYQPLRAVSGDIYLFHRLPDGRTAFFFADAAGHGVSAALITTVVVFALEAALRADPRPHVVLESLNREIGRRLPPYFFAAGLYILFEKNGRISFACAGHAPGLCVTRGGERHLLEASGPPLGMYQDTYETRVLQTGPGDLLLIYSDGLSEAEDARREPYGSERAFAHAQRLAGAGGGAQSIVDAIHADWRDYCVRVSDDVTILALEIPG